MMVVIRTIRLEQAEELWSFAGGGTWEDERDESFTAESSGFITKRGAAPLSLAAAAPFSGSQSSVSIPLNNQITTLPTKHFASTRGELSRPKLEKEPKVRTGGVVASSTSIAAQVSSFCLASTRPMSTRETRSRAAKSLFWGVLLTMASKHTGRGIRSSATNPATFFSPFFFLPAA